DPSLDSKTRSCPSQVAPAVRERKDGAGRRGFGAVKSCYPTGFRPDRRFSFVDEVARKQGDAVCVGHDPISGSGHLEKLSPGSSGPPPMTRKVICCGSCQVTRPTRTAPFSWASVRTPPPNVETPENCCVWPFCVTCQVNAPPGRIVRTIEVSGVGRAFQVPER